MRFCNFICNQRKRHTAVLGAYKHFLRKMAKFLYYAFVVYPSWEET